MAGVSDEEPASLVPSVVELDLAGIAIMPTWSVSALGSSSWLELPLEESEQAHMRRNKRLIRIK